MAKYLVDTFYTCTLKVTHFLDNISEKELENLEKREDGKFEILDIKIDKRKTNYSKGPPGASHSSNFPNQVRYCPTIL